VTDLAICMARALFIQTRNPNMITVDILESKKACRGQIKLFKEHFPNGSPLTIESALSVASIFDWGWAAHNLLSANGLKTYKEQRSPLYNTYRDQVASLWETCRKQTAPLDKTYEEQIASLWYTCRDQIVSLRKTYDDQAASLSNTYEEQIAFLFASLYISEQFGL
jgi:hypothetical protein